MFMQLLKRITAVVVVAVLCCAMGACGSKKEKVVVDIEGLTDAQKAIVITAESYFLRGNRAQYDMGSLVKGVERRLVKRKYPEDYTSQNRGYTDCSGFVYDVYWHALGIEVSGGSAWTKTYADQKMYRVLRERPIADEFDKLSEEELETKRQEFANALQPGDIIVQRYQGDESGHAMLYVGNGMYIHSSGSSYDKENMVEKFEEEGTYLYDPIENFYNPEHRRYLFDKATYTILRPLEGFNGVIPETTLTRMGVMRGIMAEKLASHTYGQTVNVDEIVTFTFRLENNSNIKKTLTVTDTVPANTAYIEGAQTVNGDQLAWTVTVPAEGTAEVSYTVKVTGAAGNIIKGSGAVEGIAVECPAVTVGNTLTKSQQETLVGQIQVSKELRGAAWVNALYTAATGKAAFADGITEETLVNKVFVDWISEWTFDSEAELSGMIAPNLYGGSKVTELLAKGEQAAARTRMVEKEYLLVGDVILTNDALYVFIGDGLLNTLTAETVSLDVLERLLVKDYFAVLRPSLMNE